MRTFTAAAAAAILATAATAAYLASPAIAQGAPAGAPAAPAPYDHAGRGHGGFKGGFGPGPRGPITWAQAKAKADEMWARLDVNKDGKLDQADREAGIAQMFDRIDANHDGSISKDEFIAHHRAMAEHRGMGPQGDHGGPPPPPPPPGAGAPDGPEHAGAGRWHHRGPGPEGLLGPADADHDKVVTRAEYDAATKARFDRADTNHDGTLSEAELRAGFARMRARDGEAIGGLHGAPGGFPPPPPPPPPSAGQ